MSKPKSVIILDAEGMMVLGATLGRHVFVQPREWK